jgi:hypothetical protein
MHNQILASLTVHKWLSDYLIYIRASVLTTLTLFPFGQQQYFLSELFSAEPIYNGELSDQHIPCLKVGYTAVLYCLSI